MIRVARLAPARRYRTGDEVTAVMDDTTGRRVTATIRIDRVDDLGCGCQRLTGIRPGPKPADCPQVAINVGCRLGVHNDGLDPEGRNQ